MPPPQLSSVLFAATAHYKYCLYANTEVNVCNSGCHSTSLTYTNNCAQMWGDCPVQTDRKALNFRLFIPACFRNKQNVNTPELSVECLHLFSLRGPLVQQNTWKTTSESIASDQISRPVAQERVPQVNHLDFKNLQVWGHDRNLGLTRPDFILFFLCVWCVRQLSLNKTFGLLAPICSSKMTWWPGQRAWICSICVAKLKNPVSNSPQKFPFHAQHARKQHPQIGHVNKSTFHTWIHTTEYCLPETVHYRGNNETLHNADNFSQCSIRATTHIPE